MFPRNENRNEGTFACSPGTKTGTRAHSPKPPFCETALLSPSEREGAKRIMRFWGGETYYTVGRCPSTVRPMSPALVFQLSKQQNCTWTTSSTVLRTPPNHTRTNSLWKSFDAVAFFVGLSTGNPPKIGTFTAWNRTRNRTRTLPDIECPLQNQFWTCLAGPFGCTFDDAR